MDKLGVEPDAIIIPVGGGGLLAGMVTVIKHLKPHMEIIVCVYELTPCAMNIAHEYSFYSIKKLLAYLIDQEHCKLENEMLSILFSAFTSHTQVCII